MSSVSTMQVAKALLSGKGFYGADDIAKMFDLSIPAANRYLQNILKARCYATTRVGCRPVRIKVMSITDPNELRRQANYKKMNSGLELTAAQKQKIDYLNQHVFRGRNEH